MDIKFKVEYEIRAIRFVKAICPSCEKEFDARANGNKDSGDFGDIHDAVDLNFSDFYCPHCSHSFGTRNQEIEIEEV
ncbi:hypothetical protein MM326_15035 [Alkalihalobacillus sp. LMS6]|uniref:hypothetical protein n=1 Tax=Alkalihalobacillus sp. LMS6 TaxID=2924034 RepID=UPI0020D184FD|nr:hypothetical protein [Alkalihalobacillus sp. LMS6]UTR05411.1 hypothetical protein MM326_15035 [Alkalihalobacillus sp. LMS6]